MEKCRLRCLRQVAWYVTGIDNSNALRYYSDIMITSFACRETQRLFDRQPSRRLPTTIQRIAQRKLEMLNAAETLDDLRIPPANRLEKLAGRRRGQYSIRINDQWRVCFAWDGQNATDVEIVDYH